MHDPEVLNPPLDPPGSAEIADDGSMAAFVPAHRAQTWQLPDGAAVPVVHERSWLTFRSGEIRVCASCHGLNSQDQAGSAVPVNQPQALRQLLRWWRGLVLHDGFDNGSTASWSDSSSDD